MKTESHTRTSLKAFALAASIAALLFASLASGASAAQCGEMILTASDGKNHDTFGEAVALFRNWAVIGGGAERGGAAYVFRNEGGSWSQFAELIPSDGFLYEDFGSAVAVTRGRVVIGAQLDDDLGQLSGSVYVYTLKGNGFDVVKLHASDGRSEQRFGHSVAATGNLILVGGQFYGEARDAAYVFRFNGQSWVEEAKLISSDIDDGFGASTAIGGQRLAIGAHLAQTNGVRTGAVYIFRQEAGAWVQEAKLVADDPHDGDFLGSSVAITADGDRVIAGAAFSGLGGGALAAYVFHRDGTSWTQEAKLLGSGTSDAFGAAVGIAGNQCVVGAPDDDFGTGAAYLFEFDGVNWNEVTKIVASDEGGLDEFGDAIALDPRHFIVGAPLHPNEFGPGEAYVYERDLCADRTH